jgi:hypothetical protein
MYVHVYDYTKSTKIRSIQSQPVPQQNQEANTNPNKTQRLSSNQSNHPTSTPSLSLPIHTLPKPRTHPMTLRTPSHYTPSHKKHRTSSGAGIQCDRSEDLGFGHMLEVAVAADTGPKAYLFCSLDEPQCLCRWRSWRRRCRRI